MRSSSRCRPPSSDVRSRLPALLGLVRGMARMGSRIVLRGASAAVPTPTGGQLAAIAVGVVACTRRGDIGFRAGRGAGRLSRAAIVLVCEHRGARARLADRRLARHHARRRPRRRRASSTCRTRERARHRRRRSRGEPGRHGRARARAGPARSPEERDARRDPLASASRPLRRPPSRVSAAVTRSAPCGIPGQWRGRRRGRGLRVAARGVRGAGVPILAAARPVRWADLGGARGRGACAVSRTRRWPTAGRTTTRSWCASTTASAPGALRGRRRARTRRRTSFADARRVAPGADVLKVGHHGSRTSTGPRVPVRAVDPSLAVISCGIRNRFGHPAAQHACATSSARSSRAGARRTDRDGERDASSTDGTFARGPCRGRRTA